MFDLEQYLGREITWVSGVTFDEVVKNGGGWLPNKLHRYCTQLLKIQPMFYWWHKNINEPVNMQIGFRANEQHRANKMLKKLNSDGLLEVEATITKHTSGRHAGKNKWENIGWQKPSFPLIESGVLKQDIIKFWEDKPVRFAPYNNCVGCFHRNPVFLRWQYQEHPNKMEWFESKEGNGNGYWKSENGEVIPYARIRNMLRQTELFSTDFTSCDSGYCEL